MKDDKENISSSLSRRTFLKSAAAGSSVLILSPAPLQASPSQLKTSDDDFPIDRLEKVLSQCGSEFGHIRQSDKS